MIVFPLKKIGILCSVLLVSMVAGGCKESRQDNGLTTIETAYRAPQISFTDNDPDAGQIGGTLVITPSQDEAALESYDLYYASTYTIAPGTTKIASYTVTGAAINHIFAQNTPIPSGVTHLSVLGWEIGGKKSTTYNLIYLKDTGAP